VIGRIASLLLGLALAATALWLLQAGGGPRGGVVLEPARLVLRPGERAEIRVVNRELEVVAWSFRARFDERLLEVVEAAPAHRSITEDGNAILLPARRAPGLFEVVGGAVIGGRVLKPFAPVHRFVVQARRPGTTTFAVEDFTAIDLGDERRHLTVAPVAVTVRP
jgi:hypothetical protein